MDNVEVVEAVEAKPLEDETIAEVDESPDVEVDDPLMSYVDDEEDTVATVNVSLEVNEVLPVSRKKVNYELVDGIRSTVIVKLQRKHHK